MFSRILLVVALMCASFLSSAESSYLTASLGRAHFDGGEVDDEDMTLTFGGGLDVNDYFGVELVYTDFGEMAGVKKVDGKAITIGAKAKYAIDVSLTVFGRVGIENWKYSARNEDNEYGTGIIYGLGVSNDISKKLRISFEYQYHDMKLPDTLDADVNISTITVGIARSF